ncbi:MAG: leucine-rich repeat protein, partial [Clostridia bacterium]|nr:leucine-rich repeat protein [Clostridia bacterium]
GYTLLFNPVANATNYTLSYVCGTTSHDHKAIDLGGNTSYNFEDCNMPDDGFKFVVTASADGWMSSISEEFTYWTGTKVEVNLDVGKYGAEELDKAAITYGSNNYTLPVPTSNSVEYAFVGWYSQAENGTQYTDHEGKSVHAWTYAESVTLYAHWSQIIRFDEVGGGYSVSATPNIYLVSEITIPQTHNGLTVTTINDFSNATTLTTIKFYNTVTNITVGSIGIAFNGCSNLEKIEVLEANGANDARFWDVDGVLLGKDTTTGDTLIYFYPYKHAIENNTYTIPDGVTRLTAGVFTDTESSTAAPTATTIVNLVVPASVVNVDLRAFYQINRLQKITFLDPSDASKAVPLNVADGAFEDMGGLDTIVFPARLANFSTAIFTEKNPYTNRDNSLSRLATVTVAKGSEKFEMIGGLITAKTGAARELLYYPTPCRLPLSDPNAAGTLKYTDTIVIPEGVTSISSNVLLRGTSDVIAANIKSITIARTVTEIKSGAFANLISNSASNKTGLSELIFKGTAANNGRTIGD